MEYNEMTVALTEQQARHTLTDFYRNAAEAAGYKETEDTVYDCRKILVSPDVQESIISAYQESYPAASMGDIMMHFAISGPKVYEKLKDNEVMVQEGFVTVIKGAS